jgi:O-antigen/teichoic acid export membrane protein
MNLQKNISVNYASQAYTSIIGILILPIYLRMMGAEAYGLIGFFTLLQAWFNLLDLGLSGTLSREAARFKGGALSAASLRQVLRALEFIFLAVGIAGMLALWSGSSYLAVDWLKISTLEPDDVTQSIRIMAAVIVLRWAGGLSRGIITGFEQLVWLGGFGALMATLRFLLVIPVMLQFGATPAVFFWYQLLVALFELAVLVAKAYALMPRIDSTSAIKIDWVALAPTLRFALSISFLTVAWIVMTQTDKLILSKLLSLSEYGHFTLAVLAASAVMMASGPISSALLPRLSRLHAERLAGQRDALYRTATRLVAAMIFPIAFTIALFAEPILHTWTGNTTLANETHAVLALYALGNSVLVIAAFPYYLQYAHGDLKLHVYGNLLFLGLLIPTMIWATAVYGMAGAGGAWLAVNLVYLAAWIPLVHRRLLPKLHTLWLLHDVLKPACISAMILIPLAWLVPQPAGRIALAMQIAACFGLSLLAVAWPAVKDWRSLSERLPETKKGL